MFVRVIRGEVRAGKLDDFAERWKEQVGGRISAIDGFRNAYLCANREANAVSGVSIWDRRPDLARFDTLVREFVGKNSDLIPGKPDVQDYEVLAEV